MKEKLTMKDEIIRLFLRHSKLRFNEIEKEIGIRSNKLAYYIDRLQKEKILVKEEESYRLFPEIEKQIPIIGSDLSPVIVVLALVLNEDKVLLIKRNKRPYKNYWGLIGGKMKIGESFKKTSLRLIAEKSGIDAEYKCMNSVAKEKVKSDEGIKHDFLLFLTTSIAKDIEFEPKGYGQLKWFRIDELDDIGIIPSDLWLIKNKIRSNLKIAEFLMTEKDGKLIDFKMNHRKF